MFLKADARNFLATFFARSCFITLRDSPKRSRPEIKARFDFRKCRFELKVKKAKEAGKIKGTSLGVALYVGSNLGEEVLKVEVKNKHLEYKRKRKIDCCRE